MSVRVRCSAPYLDVWCQLCDCEYLLATVLQTVCLPSMFKTDSVTFYHSWVSTRLCTVQTGELSLLATHPSLCCKATDLSWLSPQRPLHKLLSSPVSSRQITASTDLQLSQDLVICRDAVNFNQWIPKWNTTKLYDIKQWENMQASIFKHETVKLFCGISESFVCQHRPSCG